MIYRFGRCELDAKRLELRRDGQLQSVEPQVFSLLLFLIENRDHVVSKDDLIAGIWNGRIVADASLTSRISAARRAIGDTGSSQSIIRTFPRRGFRFVADIQQEETARPQPTVPQDEYEADRLDLPDRPSIVVLPFSNLSDDPDQEYFADGITDDIIATLSLISEIFVIARTSSFAYKGNPKDVRQIGREQGVRYVLEGSVRKGEERVRITVQLIDAVTGNHIWADRYDRKLQDLFSVQDDITLNVVAALRVEMTQGEEARLSIRGTDSLDAYECFLRAEQQLMKASRNSNAAAQALAQKALELDPNYGPALTLLGWTYRNEARYGWSEVAAGSLERASDLAAKAMSINDKDPDVHSLLASVRLLQGLHGDAIAHGEKAITLGPNHAAAIIQFAQALLYSNQFERGLMLAERAIRLSPYPPDYFIWVLGRAYALAAEFERAISVLRHSLERGRDNILPHLYLAEIFGELGQDDQAKAAAAEVLRINPNYSLSTYPTANPFKDPSILERHMSVLRRAGLPE